MTKGQLDEEEASWGEVKDWLKERLSTSQAAWKIVVGHHPIEYVPFSFLEHGLPGVQWLTAGFMKGHLTSRLNQTAMRDVVVQGGPDIYLCGHQHLMAHLVREGQERSWHSGPGAGTLDYVIVGSSSKLEQDMEDFEDELDSSHDEAEWRPAWKPPEKQPLKDGPNYWQASQLSALESKMSQMWFEQQIGFAVIDVSPTLLTVRFFTVREGHSKEQPVTTLVHTVTKTR